MNKQEAIDKINNMGTLKIRDTTLHRQFDTVDKNKVLDIISQINEPKKVVVPQFVAEWIEDHKEDYSKWNEEARADFVFRSINDLFRFEEGLGPWDFTIYEEFSKWTTENAYEFITAILFDYTVKKEKLYTVEIPNPNSKGTNKIYLCKDDTTGKVYLCKGNFNPSKNRNLRLTESEIKEDFAWAWQWAKEVVE